MGVARLIRRTAPLIVLGLAGAAAARRRAARVRPAQLPPPPYPPPVARAGPVEEVEPEPPEPEPPVPEPPEPVEADPDPEPEETSLAPWLDEAAEGGEQSTSEEPRSADASSVTEIVDDLLAPGESAERMEDVTIVEGSAENDDPESAL